MSITLDAFTKFLDRTLDCASFSDASNNGLQIANGGRVGMVVAGVDASLRLFEEAASRGADAVVCHHGLSWGSSLARITGLNHRLVSFALRHGLAVYAAHLPLDAHPSYGNNAQLCKALGLRRLKPAFTYHGNTIGFVGETASSLSLPAFCERVRKAVSQDVRALDFGVRSVRRVGVVSGGAGDMVDQAAELGLDVFLTGEASLQGYNLAENLKQNVVFAGHYATETFGVRSLAGLLSKRFGIAAELVDFHIPF